MTRPKVLRPLVSVALAALALTALPTVASAGVSPGNVDVTAVEGTTSHVAGTNVTFSATVSHTGGNAVQASMSATVSQGEILSWTCTEAANGNCGAPSGDGPLDDLAELSPVGGSVTYVILVAVPSSATGSILANFIASAGDTDQSDNSDSDSDTLTRQADLSITKTDGVTAVQPGEQVTYTIVVSNAGPSDEPVANVGDTLPSILQDASWTCVGAGDASCTADGTGSIDEFASIPAGDSVTYTLTATVDPEADGSEIVANDANVQSTQQGIDPNGANDAALDVDQVADFTADLVALKTAPATAVVGGTISYTIGVRNDGPDLARDVVLEDALPSGTTFVSMTQTTGPVATILTPAVGTGGTVEADWDTFADGATAEFTVVVQLGGTVEIGDAVVNTAVVESFDDDDIVDVESAAEVSAAATIDPVDANNDITVTTLIVAQVTTTTSTTSTTTLATTTTARVGSGALARTGGESGGPMGTGIMIVGAGLVLVGAAELRRRRATM